VLVAKALAICWATLPPPKITIVIIRLNYEL
jgi:hypothetical protein